MESWAVRLFIRGLWVSVACAWGRGERRRNVSERVYGCGGRWTMLEEEKILGTISSCEFLGGLWSGEEKE